ncbi:Aminoglycoside phosphotransferase [Niveomyces insectorum RCEF 264]|uniref:Aminoglycoside phosphotransferase n=1 Tax=Niveomyces insectorum RCEF 264 TaxID=1081102 RepID=A0A167SGR6_9HYPO|nr:Aminoglycoside phosphotransferase [Niveomyces insectorum RCEF 264]
MASENQDYNADDEIAAFFTKTAVCRDACDALAAALVGGSLVVPVAVQGVCSYTVYAGPGLAYVVQFRLKSLGGRKLEETAVLARQIYGAWAPDVSFRQQLGDDVAVAASATAAAAATTKPKEPLLVYVMTRIQGISRLDFILKHGFPEHAPENKARRKTLMRDVARFFALAWKAPQKVSETDRARMATTFEDDLRALLAALPDRLRPVVRATLASLPRILALPMALVHKDLGDGNILVEEPSCRLAGVIDWAEAEIAPFGTNLHSLQDLMSKLHMTRGWTRYEDYDELQRLFWATFHEEVGGLDEDTTQAIKAARVLGLLRSWGFTSRLANMPAPVPIKDDGSDSYKMMILDGLLVNPMTRFDGLDVWLEEYRDEARGKLE